MLDNVVAILTSTTCGMTCWTAKEPICRCSCGGANHGAMLNDDGSPPPKRTCQMKRTVYELVGIDPSYAKLYPVCKRYNSAVGWQSLSEGVTRSLGGEFKPYVFHTPWTDTSDHAPARIKRASEDQVNRWDELAPYRQGRRPYLLWVRQEMPDANFCPDDRECEKCIDQMMYGFLNNEEE